MKNPTSQGASLSHRYLHSFLVPSLAIALTLTSCKKNEESPAVIEEVPTTASMETDTSATLAEEPNLQQIGQDKPGTAKNTFHPSGSPTVKAGFSESGHYVVQVAVFKSKRQAANLVEKLANSGYPAYVAEVENPVPDLPGTYHRVRIGRFLHITDAKSFGENTLSPMGYEYWVDNKKNDGVGGEGSGYIPEPEPMSRKAKEPAYEPAPSEPATPSSESWGTPQPSEPSTPASESWGTPKTEEPAAPSGGMSGTPKYDEPASYPANTPSSPSEPASAPAKSAPGDTGKVNLDEW